MKFFWKLNLSITAIYGGSIVALAAVFMHLWRFSLPEAAQASLLSAIGILAFQTLALLTLNLRRSESRLVQLVSLLWHLGTWLFVWTVFAGVLKLPLHYSGLAPIGGQMLIFSWLLLAIASWFDN